MSHAVPIPMKNSDDVSKLIGLKRYETPGEEYFTRFAADFKERQRSEMLRQSSFSLLKERAQTWYHQTSSGTWMIPAGAAAAAVAIGVFAVAPREEEADLPVRGLADLQQEVDVSLPPFPESEDEVIELRIPTRDEISPLPASQSPPGLLNTGGNGPLIEL